MLSHKTGIVTKILGMHKGHMEVLVEINGKEERAINYTDLTGSIEINNRVVVNTTAVELGLGTGGTHFVIHNTSHTQKSFKPGGHIMKLRYTPMQLKVLAAEEQDSPYHHVFLNFKSLDKLPVIVGELHSMLLPISCSLKYLDPTIKICYIMTDAAALPISLSHTVASLKEKNIIDATITVGHAFGGDLECVNIYNGLIAAKEIIQCDVAIVAMGPGIVGTGTPYGFSGIEQGPILDAVYQLGGTPVAVPRISFADQRERHLGISHHSQTILTKLTNYPAHIVIPNLDSEEGDFLIRQINNLKIDQKHYIVEVNGNVLMDALAYFQLQVHSMGRSLKDDPAFFLTCGAVAQYTFSLINRH